MRVYVALRYREFTRSTDVGEVFVNELDAKKYKADEQEKDYDVRVEIKPRDLRTAWSG